jgi:acyl dehydratase
VLDLFALPVSESRYLSWKAEFTKKVKAGETVRATTELLKALSLLEGLKRFKQSYIIK